MEIDSRNGIAKSLDDGGNVPITYIEVLFLILLLGISRLGGTPKQRRSGTLTQRPGKRGEPGVTNHCTT